MADFGGAASTPQAGAGFGGAVSTPTAPQVQAQTRARDYQESVLTRTTLTPPGSPNTGARYLIDGVGVGGWASRDDSIAEWTGQDWIYTTPSDGMWLKVEDTGIFWEYDGSAWVVFSSALALAGPVTTVNNAASPYTVLSSDVVILCDTSGGAVTINLPASAAAGRALVVIRDGGSAVTIDGNAAETVGSTQGGGATYSLASDGDAVVLRDINVAGNEWIIEGFGTQKLDPTAAPNFAGLTDTGGLSFGAVTVVNNAASPYTVLATDKVIVCDTSGGTVQIDLPASAALGRHLTIVRDGGNNVTIDGNAAEAVGATQGGGTSYIMRTDGMVITLSDTNIAGNEWVFESFAAQPIDANSAPTFLGLTNSGIDQHGAITTVTNAASPYTVLATDSVLLCDTSGGAIVLNLPASAALTRTIRVIRDGGSSVTITPNGVETVLGAATYVLGVDGDDVLLMDTNVAGNEWSVTPDVVEIAAATAAVAGTVVPVSRYVLAADSALTGAGMGATTETAHTALTLTSADLAEARRVVEFEATFIAPADNGADTWTLRCRLGGVGGTLIGTDAAWDLVAGDFVTIRGRIQIRTIGAGGTFDGFVEFINETKAASAWNWVSGGAVDTTGTNDLVITSESSSADAGQQGTLRDFEARVYDI